MDDKVKKTIQQIHWAAQYLAAASKSFLEAKEDDSHTNLSFSIVEKMLLTWPLDPSGTKLCLKYETFSLEWTHEKTDFLFLNGKTHSDIVHWLDRSSKRLGFDKPYAFDLHYKLPYKMAPMEAYIKPNVTKSVAMRILAQKSLKLFLDRQELSAKIRVWPHHFDTGALCKVPNSKKSVGIGLAVPDALIDDYYFYISGYLGHRSLDTSTFDNLSYGKWLKDGFIGAVLPASEVSQAMVLAFFQEAFQNYSK